MENNLLYVCYSIPQRNYLKENGLRWIIGGKSFSTDKPFWVYENTEKLNALLKKWSNKEN